MSGHRLTVAVHAFQLAVVGSSTARLASRPKGGEHRSLSPGTYYLLLTASEARGTYYLIWG